jgi:hypothetical protein
MTPEIRLVLMAALTSTMNVLVLLGIVDWNAEQLAGVDLMLGNWVLVIAYATGHNHGVLQEYKEAGERSPPPPPSLNHPSDGQG